MVLSQGVVEIAGAYLHEVHIFLHRHLVVLHKVQLSSQQDLLPQRLLSVLCVLLSSIQSYEDVSINDISGGLIFWVGGGRFIFRRPGTIRELLKALAEP